MILPPAPEAPGALTPNRPWPELSVKPGVAAWGRAGIGETSRQAATTGPTGRTLRAAMPLSFCLPFTGYTPYTLANCHSEITNGRSTRPSLETSPDNVDSNLLVFKALPHLSCVPFNALILESLFQTGERGGLL